MRIHSDARSAPDCDAVDAPAGGYDMLPRPPDELAFAHVRLRLGKIVAGDPSHDFVPYYHFRIENAAGVDVGHVNFRVGDNDHIRLFAGHIGYEIREPFRGQRFALQACRAIAPFVRTIYSSVRMTCDPDNGPSIRTIERLGAVFLDEILVPPHACPNQQPARRKRRYDWAP